MNQDWKYPLEYYRRSLDVLETAMNRVAAYHHWKAFDPGPGYHIDARYTAMPVLTKQDIRRHFPHGLVPPGNDIRYGLQKGEIEFVETSGTLDIKVTNIWNQQWWDASEKSSWKLNSYAEKVATGNHPEAILANPLNVGFISDETDLPLEKRRLKRFLFLNEKTDPSSWTPGFMDRMINELDLFQPVILEANPSLLARLCRYITIAKRKVFQPRLIILTYEYPSECYYRQIRRVFDAPIASSYGTTETGYVFMQCEAGNFHQNSQFCRVDFQPFKPEYGGPLLGRILVTTFNNPWYYIVRFDVGDLVRLQDQGCPCGRDSGMILASIEGRTTNVTLTTTGRPITLHELDQALCSLEEIDAYHLQQEAADKYHLYLVSQWGRKDNLCERAVKILKGLYGQEAAVSVSFREDISPEKSGKYDLASTSFPLEIIKYLEKSTPTFRQGKEE